MSKTINLIQRASRPPATEFGLIYTCNDVNVLPKIAFYRVNPDDNTKLQYSLDWGQTFVNDYNYIDWTLDDLIVSPSSVNSQDQLESIISRTISPRAGSVYGTYPTIVPYDEFESGTFLVGDGFYWSWALSNDQAYGPTFCPSINGITVNGGCNIQEIDQYSSTSQITVTKYVG